MTFEQGSEEAREASVPICGGKAIQKWGEGNCKGPEAEAGIVYLQINHLTRPGCLEQSEEGDSGSRSLRVL